MIKKLLKKPNSVLWIIAVLLILVPLFTKSTYFQDIAVLTFLWAGLASSWNLYCGYCNRTSIGHAAFMGIGAYTSTLLYLHFGLSPWIGMIVGVAISMLFALVIGVATLRLQGTFFVLATIAFGEITRITVVTQENITAGSNGLLIPFKPSFGNMIFDGKIAYAVLTWAYMLLVIFISCRLEHSKFGYYLIAVGENKNAAESLGVDSTKTMTWAYLLSAAFTSIGGTLFAQYYMYIEPESVLAGSISNNFILISIIGGLGTAFGPFLGSLIITPLSNLLRGYLSYISGLHGFIFSLILMAVILFKPSGLLPQIIALVKDKSRKEE
ncbi:branched-chain amino acid ABC transporter permease [Caproiciproducens sp.]